MGDALAVEVGDIRPPGAYTLPVKLQAQEPRSQPVLLAAVVNPSKTKFPRLYTMGLPR